jgi:outer membrane protein assembly factor BamE (lipoprotein component of BamABCDE complex)
MVAQHFKRGLWAAVVIWMAACSPVVQKHGYLPETKDVDRIVLGQDTRETVATLIGRPSTSGLLNDVGWFYVESRWQQKGIAERKEIDRQVLAITFNDAGTVENIERFGLEQGQIVTLSRRVTEENIASAGFLRQLFGNIGTIGAGQFIQ